MVSHPEEQRLAQLPYRPSAPSVANTLRSSTVRASRQHYRSYAKSHAGFLSSGSSSAGHHHHAPLNEFPTFERSGDVEIVLVSGRREARYVLHRLYLAQSSAWFEDVLGRGDADGLSTVSSSISSSSAGRRMRFELDKAVGDEMPMLVLKSNLDTSDEFDRPPPLRPKPNALGSGFFKSLSHLSANHAHPTVDADDDVMRTYNNLFLIFYNHAPVIDTANIATAYAQCKSLLQLAASYEALSVAGPRVDHHLLRFGARLWRQIAKYPPSYLKLGYLARSRAVFNEALIHVVGAWPAGETQLRGQVPQHVLDLVEDKVDDVREMRARVEARLWRLTLTSARGERAAPGTAWLDWLVVALWRDWFAASTTSAPVSILKGGAGSRGASSSRSSSTTRDRDRDRDRERDRDGHRDRSDRDRERNRSRSRHHARNPSSTGSSSGATTIVAAPSTVAGPASAASSSPPAANNALSLARVYRQIGAGGSAYLGRDDLKRLLRQSPELCTRDALRRAERRLDDLKNLARDAVRPLVRDYLELDRGPAGSGGAAGAGAGGGAAGGGVGGGRDVQLPYLTCVRVLDHEWPWAEGAAALRY